MKNVIIEILDEINKIREILGMDANYFYPALITIVIALLPLIKGIWADIKNKYENNLLQLYRSEENEFFYMVVMIVEMIVFFAIYFASLILLVFIKRYLHVIESGLLFYVSIATSILCFAFIKKILTNVTMIRIRLIDKDRFKWLIYAPAFVYNAWVLSVICFSDYKVLNDIITILFIVTEVAGLWVYRGRYIRYEYSDITIYTNNGYVIRCDDISKIRRKKNIVIIENKNEVFHIKYDDISKTEHSGAPIVKLKNGF